MTAARAPGPAPRPGGAEPRRLELTGAAKAWLVALAASLALPAALMPLQERDALEAFHNRVLAPPPAARGFTRDPAGWFAAANRWLADRIYPIVAATHGRNRLAYLALGDSPAPNITVAGGGLVFFNGTDAEHPNDLVESACAEAAEPGSRAAFAMALDSLAVWGQRVGLPVDVVMVPTVPLLYGDRLPRSFPAALRRACAAGPAGRAPLGLVDAPEGLHLVYPFGALEALRDDPAMFPVGDFHPEGLSVETVSGRYLDAIGAPAPRIALELSSKPSEVLAGHGVTEPFPVYAVQESGAVQDEATLAAVQAATLPFYDGHGEAAYVYRNPAAPNAQALLILSDSYGYNQGGSLSAAFRTVVQMSVPGRDPASLVAAVRAIVPVDRLALVFNDSNFSRVIELAAQLDQRR